MKHFVFYVLCMIFVGSASAQPANFMIGELTFERPADWKWIDPQTGNEKARLYIFDKELKQKAIISFETGNPNAAPSFVDKWKEPYLSHEPAPVISLETNTVSGRRLVTVNISGTKFVNKQPESNQTTYGAVIDIKGEQVGARILGAKPLVEKLKPVFDHVIREALKADE